MKLFRKNEKKEFVCEECNKSCKNKIELSKHINKIHKGIKFYYNKWLKEGDEGKCKICGKETKFTGFCRFYSSTCSNECHHIYIGNVCIEKYGSKSPLGNEKIIKMGKQTRLEKYGDMNYNNHEKFKNTCLKKYGVENVFQNEKIKEKISKTNLEKFGVENPNNNKDIREKIRITCQEKYGVNYALQNKEIRDKGKITMIERYGVEHQSQNEKIHNKQMFSGKRIKKFRNTELWYQGTFELDFLEKYYNIFKDIKRGPSISFILNRKKKIYYPDFYIPSLNLIIEIKNSYLVKRDKDKIIEKEKATISNGFNYILIINENYMEFEKLIKNSF